MMHNAAISPHSDAGRCNVLSVPVRVEIMEATAEHVRRLAPRLRAADALELTSMGERPLACLWHSWRGSLLRRTAFVDGEIAAMWGVHGDLTGMVGIPWLLTAPEVERVPVTMVKLCRRDLKAMLEIYPVLQNCVLASYAGAVRLIEILGFKLDDPVLINGVAFRRFSMGSL